MSLFFADPGAVSPVSIIRRIVGDITRSDDHAYQVVDDGASGVVGLKALDDGSGGYIGVWMVYPGSGTHFNIYVGTSSDLFTWVRGVQLKSNANLAYLGKRADDSYIVGYSSELSPGQLAFRRYADLTDLLAGTHSDEVTLPRTLAAVGGEEGTPNFFDIEDPMQIGFHYFDGTRDHNGLGTLTGWSGTSYTSWLTATAAWDAPVLALDSFVTVGARELVSYLGHDLVFVGSQIVSGEFFLNYWDGATAVQQPIITHGGSGDFDVFRASIVESPVNPGEQVLFCSMLIHDERGVDAPGEAGVAMWYKQLP
jgi:hypothetical protein